MPPGSVLVTFFGFWVLEHQDMWSEERQASIIGAMVMLGWGWDLIFFCPKTCCSNTHRERKVKSNKKSGQFNLCWIFLGLVC